MTLKTARGTRALLALEDEGPDVLFESLAGSTVPLWPDVRSAFWYVMQSHDFGASPLEAVASRPSNAWLRLTRALLPSPGDARNLRRRRRALFLVSGATTYDVGGATRNWLVGDFADDLTGDSAIAQWRPLGSSKPAFSPTRSLDPMVTRAAAYSRLSRRGIDEGQVRRLVGELAVRLDARITASQIDAIASAAIYTAAMAPFLVSQFSRVLDRVNPKVVLMEDASYGGWSALVSLMKSRGILVAEPQHGWIGPTHGAYNFGAAMRSPDLLATLPDELLTFGDYWSDGIRHPARVTAVGKPHLEHMAHGALDWSHRPREVLVVSSVTDPDEVMAFTLALRRSLTPDWLIRFRPHPSERSAVAALYRGMVGVEGIEIDETSDVYRSLARSRGVVGVSSTVLFEGLAMGCRVFALENALSQYYVGDVFGPTIRGARDADAVVSGLTGNHASSGSTSAQMWKPDARRNFGEWIQNRLAP